MNKEISIKESDNDGYIVEMIGPVVNHIFVFDMLHLALEKIAELLEDRDSYYKCKIEAIHEPQEGE